MWKEDCADPGGGLLAVYSNLELPTLSDTLASLSSAICIWDRPSMIARVSLLMDFLLRSVAFSLVWGYLLE